MKNKKVMIKKEKDEYIILCTNEKNSHQLQYFQSFMIDSFMHSQTLHQIGVSQKVFEELKGEGLVLYFPKNGKYLDVVPIPLSIENQRIKVTNYIQEQMDACLEDEVILLKNKTYHFSNVKVQRIENIPEDNIVMSARDIHGNIVDLNQFLFFQCYNYYTGDSIIIKKSHIQLSYSLKNGTILLNKKQRIFLNLEVPKYISDAFWRELQERIPNNAIEDKERLNRAYSESDHYLKDDLTYEEKTQLLQLIKKYCPLHVCFFPIVDSYRQKTKKGIKLLSDFYVGKSTLSLLCRRPYESDEGSNVVRMTKSNMNLLGVTEMDQVILKYKQRSIKCRVLEMDDEKDFFEANTPVSMNFSIGVPVHIRKKLGICNIRTAIKVDRDTGFIFKKSIHEQIVRILLTFFSIQLFRDPDIWINILLTLLVIPIVVYLNLSSKRKMKR